MKAKKETKQAKTKTYHIFEKLNSALSVINLISRLVKCNAIFNEYKPDFKNDNVISFCNKKGEMLGKVEYYYESSALVVTGEKLINIYDNVFSLLTPLTEDEINNLVFKEIGDINANPSIIRKLDADFKKIGIEEVRNLNKLGVYEKVTLTVSAGNSSDSSIAINYDSQDYDFFDTHNLSNTKKYLYINNVDGENIEDIKIDNHLIGKYFTDRNLIVLIVDVFKALPTDLNTDYSSNIQMIMDTLSKVIIKKVDVSNFKLAAITDNFLSSLKEKRDNIKYNIERREKDIEQHQRDIVENIRDININRATLESYNSLVETGKSKLIEEIDKTRKLKFIENVNFEESYIYLTYKPTFLPIPNYKSSDISRDFGKRYVYLGKLTFRIDNKEIRLKSDEPSKYGNPHTHASSSDNDGFSSCCFGDGEGKTAILEELATLNISGLAFHLWMWIKTHINESSYIKSWEIYNNRLKNGLPIFDEQGNKIFINDPERLKSGEQIQLEPSSVYFENIKKYKDVIPNEIKLVLKNKSEGKK